MNRPTTDEKGSWHVPNHEVLEFGPKRARYCLCVFVINEGERIRRQLTKMPPHMGGVDLVIADGGSTDGSLDSQHLCAHNVRVLLTMAGPAKLSAQMRMAMAYAMDQGYEGVIVMDGNDKDGPEAIPRFAQALDEGFDHVQGSRFVIGGQHENTPLHRLLAVKLIHAPLISFGAGFRYTDTTNGFRAYSRRLLLDPRVQPFRDIFDTYQLHYYLSIRAPRLEFRSKEIPVSRSYPPDSVVPTKIRSWHAKWALLKIVFNAVRGNYDPAR